MFFNFIKQLEINFKKIQHITQKFSAMSATRSKFSSM